MGQEEIMEVEGDLLTPIKILLHLPTIMEDTGIEVAGEIMIWEDISKLWYTYDIMGIDKRDILVWQHRLNNCMLNKIIMISKRGMLLNNLIKVRTPPPPLSGITSWKVL